MKYGNKYSLKRLLTEKFELDEPLDTSLEDWKGYFDKAEDLDSSIKDDFLAAREMADEALEMLDDERDNIEAAMKELEEKKKAAEKEAEELRKKQEEEEKKKKDLLNRLQKRGKIEPEEWEAGQGDYDEMYAKERKQMESIHSYLQEQFMKAMSQQRMDVMQQCTFWLQLVKDMRPRVDKFAYPEGKNKTLQSRGYYPMIQASRARYAYGIWMGKKFGSNFMWQGELPEVDQIIDNAPKPKRLAKLLDEK